MSDIRFNQWLHQSGTGGVSQVASGAVGVGTTNPLADFYVRGDAQITGILTAGHIAIGSSITFGDDDRAYFGDGTDLQIYHSGSHNIINGATGQNLEIQTNAFRVRNQADSESMIVANADASVELYYNNTERIRTTNTGAFVTGILTATSFVGGLPIAGGANDRVITASSASAIQGEANLTFNGSKLHLAANSTAYDAFQVGDGLFIGNTTNNVSAAIFHQGGGADLEIGAQDMITFTTGSTAGNATERLRITSDGNITFGVTASSTAITSGTIKQVSLGKDYWNGDKGHYGALRLLVYDNGVNDAYGFGISNAELEIQSQSHIGFYAGSAASDSKRDRRFYISSTGDVLFGFNTSGSTNSSNLFNMSLGGTYHDTNGSYPKLSLWHDGTDHMGFGVSANQLDYILTSATYDHVFYGGNAGTTELLRIKGGTGNALFGGTGVSQTNRQLALGSNAEANFAIETHNNAFSESSNIRFYKSRGTAASPTAVADGHYISQLMFYGHDGTDYANAAGYMRVLVDGTVASNQVPGQIQIGVNDGSSATTAMTIHKTGSVLFTGLTDKNDPRNAEGIAIKSPSGISIQNFGSNGSHNWRIRPDDLTAWGTLEFSVSPTSNSTTDWPDASSDVVLTLQPNKDVKVNNGNLVIGTAGKGVQFSPFDESVSNPGSDSNTLDDYEEGTYVPTVNSGLTLQASYDVFSYIKIGRCCTVRGLFYPNNNPTGSGAMTMSLPFASYNYTQIAGAGGSGCMYRSISNADGGVAAYVPDNSTNLTFYKNGTNGGGWSAVTNNEWNNAMEIYVDFTYFTVD